MLLTIHLLVIFTLLLVASRLLFVVCPFWWAKVLHTLFSLSPFLVSAYTCFPIHFSIIWFPNFKCLFSLCFFFLCAVIFLHIFPPSCFPIYFRHLFPSISTFISPCVSLLLLPGYFPLMSPIIFQFISPCISNWFEPLNIPLLISYLG